MSTKTDLLDLLKKNIGTPISGQQAAERLGVSRNAVWKAISHLKEEGYPIESRTRAGYCLTGIPDLLTLEHVRPHVLPDLDVDLHVEDTVTSTNDVVKQAAWNDRPIVVIANRQTGGRGRLGRKFESPGGTGIYISIGIKPDFSIAHSPFVTMASAVAVCRAVKKVCGLETDIKWVNDVYYNRKKVCGILTEAQTNMENGEIDRLIIGTGVNCFPGSFPPEIAHKAGSLADHAGAFSRSELAAELLNQTLLIMNDVESRSFLDEYRRRCFILGEVIHVHPLSSEREFPAKALGIEDDGGLLVEYLDVENAGIREVLRTGEISIRLSDQESFSMMP